MAEQEAHQDVDLVANTELQEAVEDLIRTLLPEYLVHLNRNEHLMDKRKHVEAEKAIYRLRQMVRVTIGFDF